MRVFKKVCERGAWERDGIGIVVVTRTVSLIVDEVFLAPGNALELATSHETT
jgi:hypothetical protein